MSALLSTPAIAGYSFDVAPDLANPAERERLSASALRAFFRITEKWALTEAQKRALLGGISSSTIHAWRTRPGEQRLNQDTLVRISLVIGIYKALHIYFGDQWSDHWVTLGNRGSLFAGAPPIEYMTRHGQPGMVNVRRVLDAARGGH